MKNLEVKFSLSELEFRCCKNLFLIYGESIGEQEFDGRIFHVICVHLCYMAVPM